MSSGPRITLIHALRDSMVPVWDAFAQHWPEAATFNLLDDSLSNDLAGEGRLTPTITDRFLTLGRYARDLGAGGAKTEAILFTCSAFGPAIDVVKRDLDIPVLSPNEAAFDEALSVGGKVGLIVTFQPSQAALTKELERAIKARVMPASVTSKVATGALTALQAGDGEKHDAIIAEAAHELDDVSSIVLGQFSMARARGAVESVVSAPVITTPVAAVNKLRAQLT